MPITPYKNFYLPVDRERGWGQKVRDNFTAIDSALASGDGSALVTANNVGALTTRVTRLEQLAYDFERRITANLGALTDLRYRMAVLDLQLTGSVGPGTRPTVTVALSVTTGATGNDRNFSAAISNLGGLTIASYQWAFGDGQIVSASAATPASPIIASHSYNGNGVWPLALRVNLSDGGTRIYTDTVVVANAVSATYLLPIDSGFNLGWRTSGPLRQITRLVSDPFGSGVQLGLGYNEDGAPAGTSVYTQHQGSVTFNTSLVKPGATILSASLSGVLTSPQSFYYATSVRVPLGGIPGSAGVDASGNAYDYSYPGSWVLPPPDANSTLVATLPASAGPFSVPLTLGSVVIPPNGSFKLTFAPDPASIGLTTVNLLSIQKLALTIAYLGSA